MNTALYIAKRYLFSKKSTHAINIISGISMLGVFVGSAALIIILSVFNGFEGLVLRMYSTFTPDIRLEPAIGKTFDPRIPYLQDLKKETNIQAFTLVLQEKSLLRYDERQFIGRIKGVDNAFMANTQLDTVMVQGNFILNENNQNYAVVGANVQYNLGINVNDRIRGLQIYSPKKGVSISIAGVDEFNVKSLFPVGVFQSGQDWDDIVFIPLPIARALLNEPFNVSAIEINLKNKDAADKFISKIKPNVGKNIVIKNQIQQNAVLYKILNTEKWAVYFMLTFVLVIAIFNIIGSLTMLVIDKKKDIALLAGLGADKSMVAQIFFFEGMMICVLGCLAGIVAGLCFCLLQQKFGLISMGEGNLLVSSYPIVLKIKDFVMVFFTVLLVSVIASGISARWSMQHFNDVKENL
ncbi:MAG: ABC transporter permease [Sphingobacteriales bacterium]|nr:MAG: ABC transporter permease [Sphingobacteriales bacterium]TAF79374.1 MAG: ABC transporter permease [Sphingobacteriales bacterium]